MSFHNIFTEEDAAAKVPTQETPKASLITEIPTPSASTRSPETTTKIQSKKAENDHVTKPKQTSTKPDQSSADVNIQTAAKTTSFPQYQKKLEKTSNKIRKTTADLGQSSAVSEYLF
jgi:hypothetical protein